MNFSLKPSKRNIHIFFGELHHELYNSYCVKIAEYMTPDMENNVEDSVIEDHASCRIKRQHFVLHIWMVIDQDTQLVNDIY
jgi:hypothetical protein